MEFSSNHACSEEAVEKLPGDTLDQKRDILTENAGNAGDALRRTLGDQIGSVSCEEQCKGHQMNGFINPSLSNRPPCGHSGATTEGGDQGPSVGVIQAAATTPTSNVGITVATSDRPDEASGVGRTELSAVEGAINDTISGSKVEVKLFVGRLPRSIDEATLTSMFTSFGLVVETVIIRDKTTGQHKGSGFVKMASITDADAAIRALHNVKVVDPQSGPILVKYANGEPERLGLASTDSAQPGIDLGKLFVGSLGRVLSEADVRRLFEPYGPIEEVILMKDQVTNHSRGCAFVKFTYKENAIIAIKALHGLLVTPGSSRPLEVKFAESRRAGSAAPQNCIRAQATPTNNYADSPALVGHGWATPKSMVTPSNLNPRSAAGWIEYFTADNRPYYHNEATGLTQWAKPPEFDRFFMMYGVGRDPMMAGRCGGLLVPPGNVASAALTSNPTGVAAGGSQHTDVAGPPGANVFVFHIPNEWTQNDLAAHFSPFGPVISCYIATDKATGRNKGYGFVSFDNVHSAAKAVTGMNGYLVGSKRLKVSIKAGEERYVSHLMGPGSAAMLNINHQAAAHNAIPQHTSALPAHGGLESLPPLRNYNQAATYHPHLAGHPSYGPSMSSGNNGLGSYRASPY